MVPVICKILDKQFVSYCILLNLLWLSIVEISELTQLGNIVTKTIAIKEFFQLARQLFFFTWFPVFFHLLDNSKHSVLYLP